RSLITSVMQHLTRISRALLPRLSTIGAHRRCPTLQQLSRPAAPPLLPVSAIASSPISRCLATSSSHDAKLSSLLDSELQYERASDQQQQPRQQPSQRAPQPPPGFTVTARSGTQMTLTRQCPEDGSLLEVSFDLNGSTASPDAESAVDDHEDAPGPDANQDGNSSEDGEEILARPDLTFRVRKPATPACLTVRCSFPPINISRQMAAEEPDYPTLSIDTVAVEGVSGGDSLGEYELEADMLNDDLYKQLAEMLVHRGVTREFEHSLVQFCTAEEHRLYLRFLAEAKKFCDA
ncbi:hypothetical protein BOX15_Mlig022540g7, partial [Macrostomum lignano]